MSANYVREYVSFVSEQISKGETVVAYGDRTAYEQEHFGWFKTGLKELPLSLRPQEEYDGLRGWFAIKSVSYNEQTQKGRIIFFRDSKELMPKIATGNYYLGYLFSTKTGETKACLAPRITARVSNSEDLPSVEPKAQIPALFRLDTANGPFSVATCLCSRENTKTKNGMLPSWVKSYISPKALSCPAGIIEQTLPLIEIKDMTHAKFKEAIISSYAKAYNNHSLIAENNDVVFFGEDLSSENFTPFIAIKKDDRYVGDETGVHVNFCGNKAKKISNVFFSHVVPVKKEEFFGQLSEMALPEKWGFGNQPKKKYLILEQYFFFTYYLCWARKQIVKSADNDLAIFNTGLVDYKYDYIYGVMERNKNFSKNIYEREWVWRGFAVPGESALGKEVSNAINSRDFPKPIKYMKKLEDFYLDTREKINVDWEHILGDPTHLKRFPLAFFVEEARAADAGDIERIVAEIKLTQGSYPAYEKLHEYIEHNQRYKRDIVNELQRSVDFAWKRAEWNYKTAVPVYYAAKNNISLLLPLKLIEDNSGVGTPDIALVVSKKDSENYQGETIYTLEMAYIDSRLVSRPDSDWLRPEIMDDTGEDYDMGD